MSKFLRGKVNQAWPHSAKPPVASASIRVLSPTFISNEDPTKTITLRAKYVTDVNNRFNAIKTVIRQSVVDNDCFGLVDKPQNIEEIMALGYREELAKLNVIPKEGFRFLRDPEKVSEFMRWLDTQQDKGVLEIVHRSGVHQKGISSWQNTYIQSSYQKGLSRARADLVKSGVDIPSWEEMPGGVSGAFYQAMHADAVGLIYTRAYNELKGVTAAMDQQISRVLANGLVEGVGPYEMARRINDRVDKIGINRARTIARTETIQTFNTAVINEFASASNLIGEKVFCQWWTARDDRVRLHHSNRHGRVFSQERAQELIGEPNCRCTLVPYIKSLHQKGGVLRPAKGGTLPPKDATPIIKPPAPPKPKPVPAKPVEAVSNVWSAESLLNKKTIKTAQVDDVISDDLSTVFGDKHIIETEVSNMGGGDKMSQHIIKVKDGGKEKYVGHIRYDINVKTGEIWYDDILVNDAFQNSGYATKMMDVVDHTASVIAKRQGLNALASLEAQDKGRYLWPRLGYKITDPRVWSQIKTSAAENFGIQLKTRSDLSKLASYFEEAGTSGRWGLPNSINMDKLLQAPEYYLKRLNKHLDKPIAPPAPPKFSLSSQQKKALSAVDKKAKLYIKKLKKTIKNSVGVSWDDFDEAAKKLGELIGTEKAQVMMNRSFKSRHSASFQDVNKNGKMKNQFELDVPTSSGSLDPSKGGGRDRWEGNLFGGEYQKGADYKKAPSGVRVPHSEAVHRPTYGYLHDTDEPFIHARYGRVAMKMKPGTYNRVTFTIGNSSGVSYVHREGAESLAFTGFTFNKNNPHALLYHMINGMDKTQALKVIDRVRRGTVSGFTNGEVYIEAQFHGAIDLARDIEMMYIPSGIRFAHVVTMCEKWDIPYKIKTSASGRDLEKWLKSAP